ncbi:MAG: hypothetical protein ACLFR1_08045 [Spirochaetia bacterium]
MKITNKTLVPFIAIETGTIILFTLLWEVLRVILFQFNINLELSIGPVGFDIYVLALWLRLNPGTILGAVSGVFFFRLL